MKYALFALLLMPGIAVADEPARPVDYGQMAMSQRLNMEINNSLQMQAALMAARDEIARLNAEIEKLRTPAPK